MRRQAPRRPLQCYNPDCDNPTNLHVQSGTQTRARQNRDGTRTKRRVANVECRSCGNEWWSAHPEAVARAEKRDVNRARYHRSRQTARA